MFSGDTAFVVREPQVVHDTFPDEAVILDLESGSYFSARAGAFQVWQWLTEGRTLSQMRQAIAEGERVGLTQFLQQLVGLRLVLPQEPAGQLVAVGPSHEVVLGPLQLERCDDMQELLLLDPIHDVDESGWPSAAKGR